MLPTLWFRNTWSWSRKDDKPELKVLAAGPDVRAVAARNRLLGERFLYCEGVVDLLFTENETNAQRAFGQPNQQPYCKDGIIQAVVHGNKNAINPELHGTKASAQYRLTVAAKGSQAVRLRLTDQPPDRLRTPFGEAFEATIKARRGPARKLARLRRKRAEAHRTNSPASPGAPSRIGVTVPGGRAATLAWSSPAPSGGRSHRRSGSVGSGPRGPRHPARRTPSGR